MNISCVLHLAHNFSFQSAVGDPKAFSVVLKRPTKEQIIPHDIQLPHKNGKELRAECGVTMLLNVISSCKWNGSFVEGHRRSSWRRISIVEALAEFHRNSAADSTAGDTPESVGWSIQKKSKNYWFSWFKGVKFSELSWPQKTRSVVVCWENLEKGKFTEIVISQRHQG